MKTLVSTTTRTGLRFAMDLGTYLFGSGADGALVDLRSFQLFQDSTEPDSHASSFQLGRQLAAVVHRELIDKIK